MGKDSKGADKAPVHPANAKLGLSVGSRAPPRNKMAMYMNSDPNFAHIRNRAHQMHATKFEPPRRGPYDGMPQAPMYGMPRHVPGWGKFGAGPDSAVTSQYSEDFSVGRPSEGATSGAALPKLAHAPRKGAGAAAPGEEAAVSPHGAPPMGPWGMGAGTPAAWSPTHAGGMPNWSWPGGAPPFGQYPPPGMGQHSDQVMSYMRSRRAACRRQQRQQRLQQKQARAQEAKEAEGRKEDAAEKHGDRNASASGSRERTGTPDDANRSSEGSDIDHSGAAPVAPNGNPPSSTATGQKEARSHSGTSLDAQRERSGSQHVGGAEEEKATVGPGADHMYLTNIFNPIARPGRDADPVEKVQRLKEKHLEQKMKRKANKLKDRQEAAGSAADQKQGTNGDGSRPPLAANLGESKAPTRDQGPKAPAALKLYQRLGRDAYERLREKVVKQESEYRAQLSELHSLVDVQRDCVSRLSGTVHRASANDTTTTEQKGKSSAKQGSSKASPSRPRAGDSASRKPDSSRKEATSKRVPEKPLHHPSPPLDTHPTKQSDGKKTPTGGQGAKPKKSDTAVQQSSGAFGAPPPSGSVPGAPDVPYPNHMLPAWYMRHYGGPPQFNNFWWQDPAVAYPSFPPYGMGFMPPGMMSGSTPRAPSWIPSAMGRPDGSMMFNPSGFSSDFNTMFSSHKDGSQTRVSGCFVNPLPSPTSYLLVSPSRLGCCLPRGAI